MDVIVVGVDGSPGSRAALSFALDDAERRAARVCLVHAWLVPLLVGMPGPVLFGVPVETGPTIDESRGELERQAERLLEEELQAVGGAPDAVEVELRAVEGPAAEVLVQAAERASLLVVGRHGHRGALGRLGSVSTRCANRAPCAVVVVPPAKSAG